MQSVNAQRIWGAETNGARISLAAAKPDVAVGEAVELSITFGNHGPDLLRYPRASLWFEYDHSVVGPDGRSVPLTAYGSRLKDNSAEQGGTLLDVRPAQEVSSSLEISKLYDFTQSGRYTIDVSKLVSGPSAQGYFRVTSNRITVTVRR